MQKILKKLVSCVALSLALTGVARADVQLVPLSFTSDFTQQGSFDQTFSDAVSFNDDYLFQGSPGFSTESFSAASVFGIVFDSVAVYVTSSVLSSGNDALPMTLAMTASALSGAPVGAFPEQFFTLEIQGRALQAGAEYSGFINSVASDEEGAPLVPSPVPEPNSWGMVLAGLACVGTLARRRRSHPNGALAMR